MGELVRGFGEVAVAELEAELQQEQEGLEPLPERSFSDDAEPASVYFLIPAFNEEENIPALLHSLRPYLDHLSARLVVVDDGSSDGTVAALAEHGAGIDLVVLEHGVNRGPGRAFRTGFDHILEEARDDAAIITLDADNTTRYEDIYPMMDRFDEGYDLVLASVYAPGGKMVGVPAHREQGSKALSVSIAKACGLSSVRTVSSFTRIYRAGIMRQAQRRYGDLFIRENGFAIAVELLLKLHAIGARICEVPTVVDWTKRKGKSKMQIMPTMRAYCRLGAYYWVDRIQPEPRS